MRARGNFALCEGDSEASNIRRSHTARRSAASALAKEGALGGVPGSRPPGRLRAVSGDVPEPDRRVEPHGEGGGALRPLPNPSGGRRHGGARHRDRRSRSLAAAVCSAEGAGARAGVPARSREPSPDPRGPATDRWPASGPCWRRPGRLHAWAHTGPPVPLPGAEPDADCGRRAARALQTGVRAELGVQRRLPAARKSVRKLAELDVRAIVCYHGGLVDDDANGQLRRLAAAGGWSPASARQIRPSPPPKLRKSTLSYDGVDGGP